MAKELKPKTNSRQYALILIVFWVFVAISSLLQDIAVVLMQGKRIDWLWTMISPLGWVIWIFLTPFVVWLIRRIPMNWSSPMSVLPRVFSLVVVISVVHVAILLLVLNLYWWIDTGTLFPSKAQYWFLCPKTFTTNFLVLSVIIGITLAIENYLLNRELKLQSTQLEAQLAKAKITALRTQLNPHFLFNTLNAINTLILKKDNTNAEKMLNRLSRLLRETLESETEQWVTLKNELEFTRHFLEIYEIRFLDRLKIDYDIDEASLACKVPNFLLQPIVENAMVHGIGKMTTEGRIRISTTKEDHQLKIEVADNGPGMSNDVVSEGLGLQNTRERIEQMYKDVSIEYKNLPDEEGFIVTIILPCHEGNC